MLRVHLSPPHCFRIFHCHIDWHLASGLAVVFRYGV